MDKNLKPVVINAESYEKIILHASKYANHAIPSDQWKMVYGMLSGYSDDDFLYVKNAYPIAIGSTTEVSIGEQSLLKISEISERLDSEGNGQFIIGNYLSQPVLKKRRLPYCLYLI